MSCCSFQNSYSSPETLYGELVFVEAANPVAHQLKPQLHIIPTELAPPMTGNSFIKYINTKSKYT